MPAPSAVLLVDDLRSFVDPPAGLVVARTVGAGIAALRERGPWVQVWLDHDLGEATGRIEDVMPVVTWMCEQALDGHPVQVETVVVHTSNPVGRGNIERALRRAGYTVAHVDAGTYLTA